MKRTCTAVALAFSTALTLGRSARAETLVPTSPEQAARAASIPIVPVRSLIVQPSYVDLRAGGNASVLLIRLDLPMPYVLVPGLRIGRLYSIVRVDLPIVSLNAPQTQVVGLSDTEVVDAAIIPFSWGALGFGLATVFPTATDPVLGTGRLLLGPAFGVAVTMVPRLSIAVLAENVFSIAGDPARRDVDVLLMQPVISLALPAASYLATEPLMRFDWNRGGHATVPVNLFVGHAFTAHLVLSVGPEWIATGDGRNDVRVRAQLNYLGW